MRLSEAMRLGSMLGPQKRGSAFGENDSSCAVGAVALAIAPSQIRSNAMGVYQHIGDYFPILRESVGEPTFTGLWPVTLGQRIAHMNDYECKTREEIADWIVANGYDCELVQAVEVNEEVAVCA